jgi:hypothetical protein
VHAASRTTRELAETVEAWARKLRMPCMGASPVESVVVFKFRMEGAEPFGFRPLELRQFLGFVKNVERVSAQFDTRTMGCPFEAVLVYRQPFLPNQVGEPGTARPERRAFLEWLSTLELKLPTRLHEAVLGDTARIGVPCVAINLAPKDKSP